MQRLLPVFLIFLATVSFGQKQNDNYNYFIKRATSPIKVDGIGDEIAWESPQVGASFAQILPMDTSMSVTRTEFRMCYDDKNIYLMVINYNLTPGKPYITESMRRDFSFYGNDNNLMVLDTFDDQTNGFSFGSSVAGGQWDGLISQGSRLDLSWENRWESETTYDDEKWVWEAAIPFKTIRYKEGITKWGMNFSRLDLSISEKSSWAPVLRQFPSISLAYAGNLIWDEAPPKPKSNISLIPFITGGTVKNFAAGTAASYDGDIGLDAKIGLTSSLNLDLTVNPDFSQVEVDVQQTNLDRFELFFPERRQFFLENGDLFNNFGFNSIRPFFSRRIGLDAPIRFGARVSGKVNKKLRIGVLNTQTGKDSRGELGSNYSVVSFQQQVFARSNFAAILVNRETVGEATPDNPSSLAAYNRTLGFEYNLLSKDQQWNGKAFYLKTFSPFTNGRDNNIYAMNLERDGRKFNARFQLERVGEGINGNEVGFIRRQNYVMFNPRISYLFFPKSEKIVSHGPLLSYEAFYDKQFSNMFENTNFLRYRINFLDRSELTAWTATDFIRLNQDFDPTNLVGEKLAAGTEHRWRSVGLEYESTNQKRLTYSASMRSGGYFADGERFRMNASVGYRFQPYVAAVIRAEYNHIAFDEAEVLPVVFHNNSYDLWLVGPRIDVTFTNKLFLTNFLQYNNQTNNVNLNTRFQWRYSPASDLFIVYTDNYYADTFNVRNRAIVLKFTYWWNV